MKPILFVRIADMKYYKGNTEDDTPYNGGSYVKETKMADECYNFAPILQDGEDYEKCLGFFMMIGGNGVSQLHIEKIVGCESFKKEEMIENVTIVFVSKARSSKTMRVVGFYKKAIVYRHRHYMLFENDYEQEYLCEAKKEDCVVLPYSTRFSNNVWYVPSSTSKYSNFGFGRSNVWYAGGSDASEKEKTYVENMIQTIENYTGENWIEKGGAV